MKKTTRCIYKTTLYTIVSLILLAYIGKAVALEKESIDCQLRSRTKVVKFHKKTGHKGGWDGHRVDHICSLFNGGLDIPQNLQWQTNDDSDFKDRIENTKEGKAMFCNSSNSLPYRTVFNDKKLLNKTFYCKKK